ncbi:MAG: hypothetical protein O2827_03690 [Verrucomicrobia bacterium]|nr:hypothetical protein [Verrucomicrobiota bacterium]
MIRLLTLFLLVQVIASATTIYVETTGFSSPFYNFYLDESKNQPFNFVGSGSDSLVAGESYTFIGLNTDAHPFRMYIKDSNNQITYLVNNLGTGDSETFTLDANIDYSSYTLTYVCVFHGGMNGSFNLANASNPEQINSFETDVLIVSSNGNKYTLNGNTEYVSEYGLGIGTYTFKNVPESHPMALSNATNITYVGDVDKKLVDGSGKDFYYGDLTVYVSGNFGTASLICLYHGYMGGENMLVYGEEYALTAPSTKILSIYSSTDLDSWDLLQTETVEASESSLFLKATLTD